MRPMVSQLSRRGKEKGAWLQPGVSGRQDHNVTEVADGAALLMRPGEATVAGAQDGAIEAHCPAGADIDPGDAFELFAATAVLQSPGVPPHLSRPLYAR